MDDYRKDSHGVEAFLKILVAKVQKEVPSLRELHIWTDGYSKQYEYKVAFWDLVKRNSATMHNFFETSLGESVFDCLGATVKGSCFWSVTSG